MRDTAKAEKAASSVPSGTKQPAKKGGRPAEAGSVRHVAKMMGKSAMSVSRARQRVEAIGEDVAASIIGTPLHHELASIDENLIRKDLSEVERAMALADRPRLLALIDASEDDLRNTAKDKRAKRLGEAISGKKLPVNASKTRPKAAMEGGPSRGRPKGMDATSDRQAATLMAVSHTTISASRKRGEKLAKLPQDKVAAMIGTSLDAAEEALAITRRVELIAAWELQEREKASASAAKNLAPLSRQARRGKGEKTGATPGSDRDLASKMGVSNETIRSRKKVAAALGTATLEAVVGTDLAKPAELEALAANPWPIGHRFAPVSPRARVRVAGSRFPLTQPGKGGRLPSRGVWGAQRLPAVLEHPLC